MSCIDMECQRDDCDRGASLSPSYVEDAVQRHGYRDHPFVYRGMIQNLRLYLDGEEVRQIDDYGLPAVRDREGIYIQFVSSYHIHCISSASTSEYIQVIYVINNNLKHYEQFIDYMMKQKIYVLSLLIDDEEKLKKKIVRIMMKIIIIIRMKMEIMIQIIIHQ